MILGASLFSVVFLPEAALEKLDSLFDVFYSSYTSDVWFALRLRLPHPPQQILSVHFLFLGFLHCLVCVQGLMSQVSHCQVLLCPSSKHKPAFSISMYCQNQAEAPSGAFS